MLNQETASIAQFIIDASGALPAYYWEVQQGFIVPSLFFPAPRAVASGNTFDSFRLEYEWYIKIFAKETTDAMSIAEQIQRALMRVRCRIHLFAQGGQYTNEYIRLSDPRIREIDNGAAQLTIKWISRETYDTPNVDKAAYIHFDLAIKD